MISQSTCVTKTTQQFGQDKFIEQSEKIPNRQLNNKLECQSAQTGVTNT